MESGILTRWARCAARATSLLALTLSAGAAMAQSAPAGAPANAPQTTDPMPQAAEAAPGPAPAPAPPSVQAQELTPLDLWSAAGRDTGLPATLWRGTSPELARQVLTLVPERALSPAMAALARRVLETGANAPKGAGSDPALAALRIHALIALGDLDAAEAVLARTASVEASEPLSRAKAEVALLDGRDQEACDTGSALQQGRDGAWWLKLRAYCSVLAKQPAAAQVAVDLWRQSGGRAPAYERLMNAAINGGDPGKAALEDPLVFALSRRLNLDMTAAIATAPAPVTAAIARDAQAPAPARLEAVARALRLGAIPVQTAREVYLASMGATPMPPPSATPGWTATPTPPPDPAAVAADPSARGEAGLYAVAATSSDLTQREAAITALLGRSKTNIDFLVLSELVAPQIADLAKAGAPLRDPVLFASASALAGDAHTASAVRAMVQQNAGPGTDPVDLAILDAMIAVRAGQGAGPVLDRLIERGGAGDPRQRPRARQAALLLVEMGAPMSAQAMGELAGFEMPAGRASPARIAAMQAAAREHRTGATALIALEIAAASPQGMSAPDRAAIAGALARAGLERDAKDTVAQGLIALIGR